MKRGEVYGVIFILLTVSIFFCLISAEEADEGVVSFEVLQATGIIIYSPLNQTYNFSLWDPLELDLNVSELGFTPDTWWYNLSNGTTGEIINSTVFFTPNSTLIGFEGLNKLEVFANDSSGTVYSGEVYFTINSNSAPVLWRPISNPISICEGESLNYTIRANDSNQDLLSFQLDPTLPFFIIPNTVRAIGGTATTSLVSGTLHKSDVGNHPENISVTDGRSADNESTTIEVIEVNNAPLVEIIGVRTLWTYGDNSTFNETVSVGDIESGNEISGNFTFNLTFLNETAFFNISDYGEFNYTANETYLGVHNLTLCVTDLPLSSVHPNISLCHNQGEAITSCQNFSLTITDENRPPTIIDYYPLNLSFNESEGVPIYFNITKYDPDWTIPDAYWFVDNLLIEYDSGNSIDSFTYTFGYEDAGNHTVTVNITDGLLNDSLTWNITILDVATPVDSSSGGGGGGGSGKVCISLWGCSFWDTCENAGIGLLTGALSQESFRTIKENCTLNGINESVCGYQFRKCYDLNNCSRPSKNKPEIVQMCVYSKNPTCQDGIKNCHHGSCELLIDCGGPCPACSSCSDGIQNQGETGIDCGGPCPWKCEFEKPSLERISFWHMFLITLLLLIIYLSIKIYRLLKERKEQETQRKSNLSEWEKYLNSYFK